MQWKLINSRFPGKCVVCGGEIATGAQVYWKRRQAAHVACINGQGSAEDSHRGLEPREEKVRPLGNIRYAAPGEPEPDPAEWEYRKTSKKGNRVYVRRPVSTEMLRKMIAEALSHLQPEVREIVVKVADRPAVNMDGKVHQKFAEILDLAAQRMETLMVGPAGCGKSHLAEQIAKALGLRFGSISCSAGMSEGQITGRLIPTGDGGRFEYQRSQFVDFYEEGGVFLLDEIDAADANVLLVINQALANGHLPVPNRIGNPQAKRHPDFVLIAAANTFGNGANRMYVGRNQLDESTLDRFRIGQVVMDYDQGLEESILSDRDLLQRLWTIRGKVADCQLRRVVSTRFLAKAATMQAAGWSPEKIIGQLVCGWTEDERTKVGVN
jgi:dynein-related subfamily AAA family protein